MGPRQWPAPLVRRFCILPSLLDDGLCGGERRRVRCIFSGHRRGVPRGECTALRRPPPPWGRGPPSLPRRAPVDESSLSRLWFAVIREPSVPAFHGQGKVSSITRRMLPPLPLPLLLEASARPCGPPSKATSGLSHLCLPMTQPKSSFPGSPPRFPAASPDSRSRCLASSWACDGGGFCLWGSWVP